MKDEALKLALEAHQAMREWIDAVPDDTVLPAMPGCDRDWLDTVEAILKKALAQPAPVQEPVAWSVTCNGAHCGNSFDCEQEAKECRDRLNLKHPNERREVVPLYTTPPAQTAPVQPVCKECNGSGEIETGIGMMACTDCPPAAQRQWVGLTDAEKQWIRITEWTVDELIEWVNTKLKEKNA
jgi:hypothetical protein